MQVDSCLLQETFLNWGTGFVDKHILACLCFLGGCVFVRVQIEGAGEKNGLQSVICIRKKIPPINDI